MQEAKRFSTALFGFDRKAVLDYIYEQDKQAREALEELAVRNDTLDRKAAELNEKLEAMSAQYKQAVSDSKEKERQLNEQGSDCARLRERTNKLAAQLRDKENALQLQMMPAQPRDNHLLTAVALRPCWPGIIEERLAVTFDNHRQPLPDIQHRHPPFVRGKRPPEGPHQQEQHAQTQGREMPPALKAPAHNQQPRQATDPEPAGVQRQPAVR